MDNNKKANSEDILFKISKWLLSAYKELSLKDKLQLIFGCLGVILLSCVIAFWEILSTFIIFCSGYIWIAIRFIFTWFIKTIPVAFLTESIMNFIKNLY